ncbi:YbgA family protein [Methylomarinum vadi]|uniref:YbgA family protein n=1 Tax=Methylomarinum vadi TaxID=438855 RepID=UPI0004DF935E|nr:DUF523 and DUF1722 domain-containing protein [Methylomarinum vadi]
MASNKIPVGISSCLLGDEVRYDGGHKRHSYIEQTLGQYFEFHRFCPEVASGMGIPRPAVQLRETEQGIRCVGVKDRNLDVTDQLQDCCRRQDAWLATLSGYILKKDSPSCGMERVRVYRKDYPQRNGTGLFVQHIKSHFPLLPLEEEGRLGDPGLRENFIQRVFVYQRWRQLNEKNPTPNDLMIFHSRHKLIAMSHNQNQARELGRIAASADSNNIADVADRYISGLMQCLHEVATRGNHVNVLQHIQGYLKKKLDSEDKKELSETIEKYRQGVLPLIVPITLLRHHFRRQPDSFIERSYYLSPHPEELALLNDI